MRKSRSNFSTCETSKVRNLYIFIVDDNKIISNVVDRSGEERAFVRLVKLHNRQHIEVRNPGFRDTIREISDHVFGQRAHKAMGREARSVESGVGEWEVERARDAYPLPQEKALEEL